MTRKITALLCSLLSICLFILPSEVCAVSTTEATQQINADESCTLSIAYGYDGLKFASAEVSIYRIASVSADFQYTYTDEFKAVGLKLNGLDAASDWDTLRTTLDSYIASNKIQPTATVKTDESGTATFKKLKTGLYFVSMVAVNKDGFRYYFYPALVSLPNLNEQTKDWDYSVSITPKPEVDPPDDNKHDDVRYKVVKLWRNDKGTVRPNTVTVDIIRNYTVVKTVILSEATGWTYEWIADDDGSIWNVAERDVPSSYVSTVDKYTTTFTITNTVPSTPTPNGGGGKPANPKTGDSINLTLYIMLMCISGMVLIVLGITGKRKSK